MLRLEYITGWLQRHSGNGCTTSHHLAMTALGLPWWVNDARPLLDELARWPVRELPPFVQQCAVAQRYLRLLGDLDWGHFPEPPLRHWATRPPELRAHFVAAFLVKLQEPKESMPDLREFLVEHPALLWLLAGAHWYREGGKGKTLWCPQSEQLDAQIGVPCQPPANALW